jgi:heptosyltransferase-2
MSRLGRATRLLVRAPSWLGDLVMAEPALSACAQALQGGRLASVSVAGPRRFLELLEGQLPGVRLLSEEESWRGHDAAVFLDGSLRSLWRAHRAGIGARWSWWSGGRSLLANRGYSPSREYGRTPLHLGRRGGGARRLPRPFGADCAELLGCAGLPVVARAPRITPSAAGRGRAEDRLAGLGLAPDEPFLALDASARPGSSKGAPRALWEEVVAGLRAAGAPRVVLLSAPGEEQSPRELSESLAGGAWLLDPPPDLSELAALLERASLFLGADSGPRHLAAAVGAPAVVLYGPSDPRHTADHTGSTRRLAGRVACGPCHRELCAAPLGDRACFAAISPAAVVDAALASLAR